jgi:uncharacterized protein (UPF0276 family)
MSSSNSSITLERQALGLGLRPAHYEAVFEGWPSLDYFEILTDNYLGQAAQPSRALARVCSRYPVVLHGVGLNLLGHSALNEDYLDAVARLADQVNAPFVTDHLCWTGAHGLTHHDLLPVPYTHDIVDFAASRAHYVQQRIGRPFGLENLSTYLELNDSKLSEHEFYTRVVRDAGCWFMLDINNVYVSGVNHGFDALTYIDAIDFQRVLQVHLAGHTELDDRTLIDTHDQPVCDGVWQLYRHAWARGGPFPTLLEWDRRIPPLPELLRVLERAREVRA